MQFISIKPQKTVKDSYEMKQKNHATCYNYKMPRYKLHIAYI